MLARSGDPRLHPTLGSLPTFPEALVPRPGPLPFPPVHSAWQEIASNFGNDVQEIAAARLTLANAVLSIADDETCNVEVLKRATLQRIALDYRRREDHVHPPDGTMPIAKLRQT